jgi:hypothetical protein
MCEFAPARFSTRQLFTVVELESIPETPITLHGFWGSRRWCCGGPVWTDSIALANPVTCRLTTASYPHPLLPVGCEQAVLVAIERLGGFDDSISIVHD